MDTFIHTTRLPKRLHTPMFGAWVMFCRLVMLNHPKKLMIILLALSSFNNVVLHILIPLLYLLLVPTCNEKRHIGYAIIMQVLRVSPATSNVENSSF